jgi:hypothetical protein
MGANQGVQNFLLKMFDPCLANVPKIKEHDKLGKANLEYENKKKINL